MTSEGWGAQGMWRIDSYSPLKAHRLGHLGSDSALEALEGLQAVSVAHAAGCQGLCHDSCPLLGALGRHRQLKVAGGSRGLAGQRGGCIGKAVSQICGDLHACAMCQKCSPGNHLASDLDRRHQQSLYSNSKAGTTEPHAPHVAVMMHKGGSSTVGDLYDWAHLVQAWQRPGGGVGSGLGRGAVCHEVAAVQAGAEVGVLHLQRYADMQVAALSKVNLPWPSWPPCGLPQSFVYKASQALQYFRLTGKGAGRGGFWAVSTHSPTLSSGHRVQVCSYATLHQAAQQ